MPPTADNDPRGGAMSCCARGHNLDTTCSQAHAEYQTGPPGCHGEQGQDARGGDPEDNRAAMAASGTS